MLASSRTPRRRKHTGWAVVAGRHVGEGHAPPANLAAARTPAGWFGPLVKGGWLRRKPQTGGLFKSRQPFPKGCAGGGTLRVAAASGGGISGRGNPSDRAWRRGHLPLTREANCRAGLAANREARSTNFVRRSAIYPTRGSPAAAQTPAGGPWPSPTKRGKCCNQPGNRDLDFIANPCRGRFYIGPVCDAANTPGGYGIRPYNGFSMVSGRPGPRAFFRNSSAPGNGLPVWLPPRRAFRG